MPLVVGLAFGGVFVGYSIAMWHKVARSSGRSQRVQRTAAAVLFGLAGALVIVGSVAAAVA